MKTLNTNRIVRKYGRKALIIYLCWCLAKGILFLVIGYKIFG